MVSKKYKSKRTTLKDKYKMERKVKDHHRKQRKERNKAVREGKVLNKPKKQLNSLPNLMPYKEAFLRKLVDEQEREKEQERQRIKRLHAVRAARDQEAMEEDYDDADADAGSASADSPSLKRKRRSGPSEDDLANAQARSAAFEERQEAASAAADASGAAATSGMTKGKKRMYMKELRTVVDNADVVLLVVDARDPMGCRAPQAERMVMENARNKRLIILLNKVDLVPKEVAEQWLTTLRKEFPTIAFRSSTQQQRTNLGRAAKDSIGLGAGSTATDKRSTVGDSVCVGADTLLQLIKNYSRNRGIKSSITVAVVGYPNVGKSSVINSLKRSRAVGVSPTPGFTKTLQSVQLDKKVKLIDSPGVLFQDNTHANNSTSLVLRNCLNPGGIPDPLPPVTALVELCDREQLMVVYKVARFASVQDFLVAVATKREKRLKGGKLDLDAAARLVLQDWNNGKIKYFVPPPQEQKTKLKAASKVSTEWAKEFDLEKLLAKEHADLVEHMPSTNADDCARLLEKL